MCSCLKDSNQVLVLQASGARRLSYAYSARAMPPVTKNVLHVTPRRCKPCTQGTRTPRCVTQLSCQHGLCHGSIDGHEP